MPRQSASLSVVLGLLTAACGAGDDDDLPVVDAAVEAGSDAAAVDGGADAGADRCLGTRHADLLTRVTLVDGLEGARELATDGDVAVVCGDGFVRAVRLEGAAVGAPFATGVACRGVAVSAGRAAITTSVGEVVLLSVAADGALAEIARALPGGALEGAMFADDALLVAGRAAGVLRYDVSQGGLTPLASWPAARDARALAIAGVGRIVVADGNAGAVLLDAATGDEVTRLAMPEYDQIFVDPDAPGGVRDVILPFEADSIAVSNDWLVVGCGAYGHVRATRAGDAFGEARRSPGPFGRPPGVEGVVRGVALRDDELLYADGVGLVRMGLGADGALSWLGREPRPGHGTRTGEFWQAVATGDDETLALSTGALYRIDLAPPAPTPSIDLGRERLFAQAVAGEGTDTVVLQVANFGSATLALRLADIAPSPPLTVSFLALPGQLGPEPDDASCLLVPPGGQVAAVEVVFAPSDDAPVPGVVTLETNDPDAPRIELPVDGNPRPLTVGDPAPDFALVSLDGDLTPLSDYAGDVVLLKFFNFE